MKTGRFNMVIGILVLVIAAFAGFALGNSIDPYYAKGFAQIPLTRTLTRVGHTHGMLFGLVNIVFGLLIARLTCSPKLKTAIALFTALALLLPIGVSLRGLNPGLSYPEHISMVGGFAFLIACVLLLIGVSKTRKI